MNNYTKTTTAENRKRWKYIEAKWKADKVAWRVRAPFTQPIAGLLRFCYALPSCVKVKVLGPALMGMIICSWGSQPCHLFFSSAQLAVIPQITLAGYSSAGCPCLHQFVSVLCMNNGYLVPDFSI